MSPEHREFAELMVDRARADLRTARQLLAVEDGDETIIGFHQIPYTHDLAKLITALSTNGLEVPAGVASVIWLTPWGTTFRYEDPGNDLDTDDALEAATTAINLAEEALA